MFPLSDDIDVLTAARRHYYTIVHRYSQFIAFTSLSYSAAAAAAMLVIVGIGLYRKANNSPL